MKHLKRLSAILALTSLLALPAFAGETPTPPCPPPDPGEVNNPPCSGGQQSADDSTTPGEVNSPESYAVADVVTDAAIDILQSVLSIF